MESFGNFLKSLSETLNGVQAQEQTVQQEERTSSSVSESGYGSQSSSSRRSSKDQSERERRMKKIRNQGREDDDEEIEATGGRRNSNNPANNGGIGSTGAAVGIAALALGTYAIGKMFFSSSVEVPKFSMSSEEIVEAIKKIEE
jgi:hypothetical protein